MKKNTLYCTIIVYLLISCLNILQAKEKLIVLPLNGFLLNKSPKDYSKTMLINEDYVSTWSDYYILPHATAILRIMAKLENIKIVFYDNDSSWAKKVLERLGWEELGILYAANKIDVTKIPESSTKDVIIFGTTETKVSNQKSAFYISQGRPLYFIEDEDDANDYIGLKKNFYADSSEEFINAKKLIFKIYSYVQEIAAEDYHLKELIEKLEGEDVKNHHKNGEFALNNNYTKSQLQFTFKDQKVSGCQELSYGKVSNEYDLDTCIQKKIVTNTEALLISDFKPFVKNLSRDVYVYHYYDNDHPKLKNDLKNDPIKLISWYRSAWNVNFSSQNFKGHLGIGLYGALDPSSSMRFGDDLARITIPGNTTFLDIGQTEIDYLTNLYTNVKYRNYDYAKILPITEQTVDHLEKENCHLGKSPYTMESFNQDKNCFAILRSVVAKLNVQFILYRWGAGSNLKSLCDKMKQLNHAVYFTNFTINTSNTRIVDRDDEEEFFEDYEMPATKKLLGCHPEFFAEDRFSY
jgi:hypothetical protein